MNVMINASKTNMENTWRVRIPADSPTLRTISSTKLYDSEMWISDRPSETYPLQVIREPTVVASRQLKPSALDESVHPVNLPVKSSVAMKNTNPHAVPDNAFQYKPTPCEADTYQC